jgi:hypothetical protein
MSINIQGTTFKLGATDEAVDFLVANGIDTDNIVSASITINVVPGPDTITVIRRSKFDGYGYIETHPLLNNTILDGAYIIPGFENADEAPETYDWEYDGEDDEGDGESYSHDDPDECTVCGIVHEGYENMIPVDLVSLIKERIVNASYSNAQRAKGEAAITLGNGMTIDGWSVDGNGIHKPSE